MPQAEIIPTARAHFFPPLAYKNVPVLTTEMLAQAYEVEAKQIRQNFANNKERFIEGKHFFSVSGQELKTFLLCVENFDSQISPKVRVLTLWTDRGCARHAKSLNTDTAWDMYELLEETFFAVAKPEQTALPSDTLTPEQQAHLQAIVAAKAGMVPASHRRRAFQEIWARFNNNFQIARYAQLPPARIGEAVEYLVSMEVKAAKALPPTDKESLTVAASTALAFRADFPDDMGSDRKEAMQRIERIARDMHTSFTVVRNIVRLGCHPGSKTMRMSLDEREAYEILHNLYTTADESLCAAYNALDAGYKLGRLYGRG